MQRTRLQRLYTQRTARRTSVVRGVPAYLLVLCSCAWTLAQFPPTARSGPPPTSCTLVVAAAGWDTFLLPPPAALAESLLAVRPDNRALAPQSHALLVDREAVEGMLAEVRRVVRSDRFHEALVVSHVVSCHAFVCEWWAGWLS